MGTATCSECHERQVFSRGVCRRCYDRRRAAGTLEGLPHQFRDRLDESNPDMDEVVDAFPNAVFGVELEEEVMFLGPRPRLNGRR